MSIYLTAIIKSKPEKIEELKMILLNMVSNSRKESACLQYDLHQAEPDGEIFIFQEEWTDHPGLDKHNQSAYIQAFVQKSETLTDSVFIYKTEKLV